MTDTAINAGLRIALEQINAALRRHGIEPSGDYGADIERLALDAARYRQLRENSEDRDVLNTGVPWVVCVSPINGVPSISALYGQELDFALDRGKAKGHSL
ncbi:hypothetical protein FHW84_002526 [Dyella sp. SG562]|uniref:hypothetical protein n=1 Tax=Dyella sp. SG562 TaxID=2587017 RepID=UPI001420B14E|nr:hypothetical protein [Dyella sp. SG562]NII73953.1 hypothetical protein [Dyella sp. SG562]